MSDSTKRSAEVTILDLFDRARDEPLTTIEVADKTGQERRTAYNKLDALVDRGLLKTKKVGASGRVWWRSTREREHDEYPEPAFTPDNITEHTETGEALFGSDGRFREMIDALPEAVYTTDVEGRLTHFNPAAVEFSGRTPELGTDEWCVTWKLFEPDGTPLPHDECPMAVAMKEGRSIRGAEAIAERPDGTRLNFEAYPSPLRDEDGQIVGGINMLVDVTERKRTEKQLRQSEQELADFFENATVGMHWVGPDGTILRVNQSELDLLGYDRDEYVGHHIANFHADQDVIDDILQRLSSGEELHDYEARMQCKDGSIRHVLINSNVYREDGEFVHTRCVTRDITERKEHERRLRESNERLEQFAYAASHDLKEPLRMVSSYLQLIEDRYADALDEDGREFIDFAVDGADRMRAMINGLLDYSRIETQGNPFEPVDLDAVFACVRKDLSIKIEESGAEIAVESLPQVEGDGSQLQQVFQNVLDNAIEYCGEEPPEVHVSAERDGSEWRISISDEGIGIKPDDRERVFQLFDRLHTHDEYTGAGIGLALCERIVERHDGEIWVDSEPGEGSTFSFTLPDASDQEV